MVVQSIVGLVFQVDVVRRHWKRPGLFFKHPILITTPPEMVVQHYKITKMQNHKNTKIQNKKNPQGIHKNYL
jgi:hypothetical protein